MSLQLLCIYAPPALAKRNFEHTVSLPPPPWCILAGTAIIRRCCVCNSTLHETPPPPPPCRLAVVACSRP